MRQPWNSSFRPRSKSMRTAPSSDWPVGCSIDQPPSLPQPAEIVTDWVKTPQETRVHPGNAGSLRPGAGPARAPVAKLRRLIHSRTGMSDTAASSRCSRPLHPPRASLPSLRILLTLVGVGLCIFGKSPRPPHRAKIRPGIVRPVCCKIRRIAANPVADRHCNPPFADLRLQGIALDRERVADIGGSGVRFAAERESEAAHASEKGA